MPEPAPPPDLLDTLRETVGRYGMFAPDQTVVVGASGGADSTALLYALAGLQDEWRLSLVACHLNHGFRGEEAEGDAAYVRALCERLGVACRIESVDVPGLARRRHLSGQQAAREVRHAFLRRIALEVDAGRIALAHTRDDRAETVLLNLLRGSGLDGVAGFAPSALPLVRPLYDTSRAQVNAYCALHDLQPRQDSSNLKTAYRRNRVRLDLLPLLRRDYNPHVEEALLRLADLAHDDDALLRSLAATALDGILARHAPGSPDTLMLTAAELNALPSALRGRVIRLAILRVRGHLQDVDYTAVHRLLAALERGQEMEAILPAGQRPAVVTRCRNGAVEIFRAPLSASAVPWSVLLAAPGHTLLPQARVTLDAVVCRPPDLPRIWEQWRDRNAGGQNAAGPGRSAAGTDRTLAVWAMRDVTLPLLARAWQPGDRMRPRGLDGTKKLQDIFTDAKTPPTARATLPVILDHAGQGRVLSAGHLRVDETALLWARLPHASDASSADVSNTLLDGELHALIARLAPSQELLALLSEYEL